VSDISLALTLNQRTQQPDELKSHMTSYLYPPEFIDEQEIRFYLHRQGDRFCFPSISLQQKHIHQPPIGGSP
jgi:hypothetical protein